MTPTRRAVLASTGGLLTAAGCLRPTRRRTDAPDRVRTLCEELDLIHVVDRLRDEPVADHDVAYARLHGLNEAPHDYDYDYDATELDELAARLRDDAAAHEQVFCLFNNHAMYENAVALRGRLE